MAGELLFKDAEWNAAMPQVVKEMTAFLRCFRAPVFEDHGTHGDGHGTGSYLQLGSHVLILTNDHVAAARECNRKLIYQLAGEEDFRPIVGNHVAVGAPYDIALLPVDSTAWTAGSNQSRAITLDRIAVAHAPVLTEILSFTGFAGENVGFHFGTVTSMATCYTAKEIPLPADDERFSARYHFGLDYRPDLATDVIGNKGLPLPPGLSGSAVWNTRFVEARMSGQTWTPEMAVVTGIIWGWPSNAACLVATRSEYLRSILLTAESHLGAAHGRAPSMPPATPSASHPNSR